MEKYRKVYSIKHGSVFFTGGFPSFGFVVYATDVDAVKALVVKAEKKGVG